MLCLESEPLDFGPALADSELAAVTIWWDVVFAGPAGKDLDDGGAGGDSESAAARPIVLSTSPRSPPTHWMQLSVLLGDFFPVPAGAAIDGVTVTLAASEDNPRFFTFSVET